MIKGVRDYGSLLSSKDLVRGSSFEITDVKAGKIQVRERGTKFFGKTICWVQDQFHLHLKKRVLSGSQTRVYNSVMADISEDKSIAEEPRMRAVRRLFTLEQAGVPLRVRYLRNLARRLESSDRGAIYGDEHLNVVREASDPEPKFSISFREVDRHGVSAAIGRINVDEFATRVTEELERQGDASFSPRQSNPELLEDFRGRVMVKTQSAGSVNEHGDFMIRQIDVDNIHREALTELCQDHIEMKEDMPQVYKTVIRHTRADINDFGELVSNTLNTQGSKFKAPPSREVLIAIRDSWKAGFRAAVKSQIGDDDVGGFSVHTADDQLSEVCSDFIKEHRDQVEPTDTENELV